MPPFVHFRLFGKTESSYEEGFSRGANFIGVETGARSVLYGEPTHNRHINNTLRNGQSVLTDSSLTAIMTR
jgi:hypothetical protein